MPESDDLMRAGEEALQSARLLVEHNLWADAISRAYYAMVYATRALLGEKVPFAIFDLVGERLPRPVPPWAPMTTPHVDWKRPE